MPRLSLDYQLTRDMSKRQVKPIQIFGYSDFALFSFQELTKVEPKTYSKALKSKKAKVVG